MGVTGGVLAGFLRFMISIVRLSKADLKVRLYDNRGRSTDVEVGLPVEASAQATSIDQIIVIVHWLMLVMFVGWSAYFIWNIQYQGPDGVFGRTRLDLVSAENPLGPDPASGPAATKKTAGYLVRVPRQWRID